MRNDILINYNDLKIRITEFCKQNKIEQQAKIIAVSKTFPIEDILELYNNSEQRSFAENYVQELQVKAEALKNLNIEWHFIGGIQSNKIRQIAQYATWVHSLESPKHAIRLNDARSTFQRPRLNILIEINISQDKNKHGISHMDEIIKLADLARELPFLKLRGLMGIASDTEDPYIIFNQFSKLKSCYDKLNQSGYDLDSLSMGMSHDYLIALKAGATILRIGSKIFGTRTYAK